MWIGSSKSGPINVHLLTQYFSILQDLVVSLNYSYNLFFFSLYLKKLLGQTFSKKPLGSHKIEKFGGQRSEKFHKIHICLINQLLIVFIAFALARAIAEIHIYACTFHCHLLLSLPIFKVWIFWKYSSQGNLFQDQTFLPF